MVRTSQSNLLNDLIPAGISMFSLVRLVHDAVHQVLSVGAVTGLLMATMLARV